MKKKSGGNIKDKGNCITEKNIRSCLVVAKREPQHTTNPRWNLLIGR